MSLAAAQSAKRNLQCIGPWRMKARQNHLAPIIIFQIQVTRKAIYVHCYLTCRLNCHEIPKFSPTNAPLVMKRINKMYKKVNKMRQPQNLNIGKKTRQFLLLNL